MVKLSVCINDYGCGSFMSMALIEPYGGVLLLYAVATVFIGQASALGCFVCSSINKSEPECEDTFNNTGKFYRPYCLSGRKGRNGYFPATECIKMKAERDNGDTILVRACVVDNGGTTAETEIGRSDHCGLVNSLKFQGRKMHGCVLSCRNFDGCNGSAKSSPRLIVLPFLAMFALAILR